MSKASIKPIYARFDPAHLFDGLFVPTAGKKRGRLFVEPRPFGDVTVSFQGFEQLGADDQSFLLAISAQLGIDGLVIDAEPQGPISAELRLAMKITGDDGAPLAMRRTSLRSLLIDAGYKDPDSGTALKNARESLNRLRSAQIREVGAKTRWDRATNLISTAFNDQTGETFVAANPRLTAAVFKGHHVKVSLLERNQLESEAAKLLHCWLCSNIRLGDSLGTGHGADIDTLAPHVWGPGHEVASKKVRSHRRGMLKDALAEIDDRTRSLHDGYGWAIDVTRSGIALVSRPQKLPPSEVKKSLPVRP